MEARGIAVEGVVGQFAPVRLVMAWADSDQAPFLLGQFNFFQAFDVFFFRSRRIFGGVPVPLNARRAFCTTGLAA